MCLRDSWSAFDGVVDCNSRIILIVESLLNLARPNYPTADSVQELVELRGHKLKVRHCLVERLFIPTYPLESVRYRHGMARVFISDCLYILKCTLAEAEQRFEGPLFPLIGADDGFGVIGDAFGFAEIY